MLRARARPVPASGAVLLCVEPRAMRSHLAPSTPIISHPFLIAQPRPFAPGAGKYRVELSESTLSFGYACGCTRISVPVSEIGAVQVSERTSCCAWGGYGIRQNLAGETGYIADGGPSVKITHERPEGKAKVYVFSCTGAAELKEKLLAGSGGVVGDADAL
jgi:hypothetical protein